MAKDPKAKVEIKRIWNRLFMISEKRLDYLGRSTKTSQEEFVMKMKMAKDEIKGDSRWTFSRFKYLRVKLFSYIRWRLRSPLVLHPDGYKESKGGNNGISKDGNR